MLMQGICPSKLFRLGSRRVSVPNVQHRVILSIHMHSRLFLVYHSKPAAASDIHGAVRSGHSIVSTLRLHKAFCREKKVDWGSSL